MSRRYSLRAFEKRFLLKTAALYGIDNYTELIPEAKECICALLYAYYLLSDVCPAHFDCGELCGRLCCGNTLSDESGMYLFPYEDLLLSHVDDYEIKGKDEKLLICKGHCSRDLRPLSCRIFPYFSYVKDGKTQLVPDARARMLCPLLYKNFRIRIKFIRAQKLIAREFSKIPALQRELLKTGEFISEIDRLQKRFFN